MSSHSTLNGDVENIPKEEKISTVIVVGQADDEEPTKDFKCLPIPSHLRYHHGQPFHFSIWKNWGLSLAATFCEIFPTSNNGDGLTLTTFQ